MWLQFHIKLGIHNLYNFSYDQFRFFWRGEGKSLGIQKDSCHNAYNSVAELRQCDSPLSACKIFTASCSLIKA